MKLKCNAIQRFISDYIDDALSTSDTERVEGHLNFCHTCQHEVTALKKTRDLVVDYYVEPEVSDNYYHQFEVELHRCIESKGPTPLYDRLKTSVGQFTWSFLTGVRQSFGRYSFISRNVVPLGTLLLLIVTGFVATHVLEQEDSPHSKKYSQQADKPTIAKELATVNEKSEVLQGNHNDYIIKRKAPSEISSTNLAANDQKVGYWKLAKPLTTETEGHIIVMHISNDRSVPTDDANSELIVYAQPDILSKKSLLQDEDYAMSPLELQVAHYLEQYPRKHRKSLQSVDKLMNVPSEVLTISESYDFSKM